MIKELGFDCSSPKLSDVPLTQIPFLANLNQFSIPLVQTKLDESIDVPLSIELALDIYKPEFFILSNSLIPSSILERENKLKSFLDFG